MTGRDATGQRRAPRRAELLGYACAVVAVWLGWEIVKQPFLDRAAPTLAIRLSPTSPEVLRRAAEIELGAERIDNARTLADESLRRAPFNARALRVRGLAEAKGTDVARADDIVTLAGNWSLRDDPAHVWLMEHRLRRGDYASSFAHADTLARRRSDLQPQLFNLFTTAAIEDRRSVPVLGRLVAASPPWRPAFLNYLHGRDDGDQLLAELAIGLQKTDRPFTVSELGHLYRTWAQERRFAGIRFLREQVARPALSETLQNGDFDEDASVDALPFDWRFGVAPGLDIQITEDDVRDGENALRVTTNGRADNAFVEQLMTLDSGAYRLTGEYRVEQNGSAPIFWVISCAETGAELARLRVRGEATSGWQPLTANFAVPVANCSAQWVRLETRAADRRAPTTMWFDNLKVQAVR